MKQVVAALLVLALSTAAADSTNVYPENNYWWTGTSTKLEDLHGGTQYLKDSGRLRYRMGHILPYTDENATGYAKFDLGPIPDDARIQAVTLSYYQYSVIRSPRTHIRTLASDPVGLPAQQLYGVIQNGDLADGMLETPDIGWVVRELNDTAVSALQDGLADDWAAFAVWSNTYGDVEGLAYGYGGGHAPYLSVTYFIPNADVGATAILSPPVLVDSGTVVTPLAVVENFGTESQTFPVRFRVGDVYQHDTTASLEPDQVDTVAFAPWTAQPIGRYWVACSTMLAGDQVPVNDAESTLTYVRRVTGIGEGRSGRIRNEFALVANPATPVGLVRYSLPLDADATLTVHDITGHAVWHQRVRGVTGTARLPVLPSGIYLVRLQSRSLTATERLVLQR